MPTQGRGQAGKWGKFSNLQSYLKNSKSDPKDSTTYQIANSFLYNFDFMQICLLFINLSIYLQSN